MSRNRREAAVEGWCSAEELTRWGFEHAQVVMANEAHNGVKRCIRTRDVGVRIVQAAHQAGVRRLAMEALPALGADPAELLSREFTNRRELEQARNLCQVLAAAAAEPLLVWCGNGHATKEEVGDWIPMGWQFRTLSGTDPFVIDQTLTVAFDGQPMPWVPELLADLSETITAHGGTAGILRDQAPPPVNDFTGVDGVIISTENTLT